ncbi:MAG: electron transport complex subunit RsxC [Calditrichaeota bacterium]|nr:MAG: electron transport complex subunit RsxC [Calditrichota bacterium]
MRRIIQLLCNFTEKTVGIFANRTFSGGIHPAAHKQQSAAVPIEPCPTPPVVIIPVQQHIGAPSKPIVEKGAVVKAGEPISESGGFVSVPAHSSVSGVVQAIEKRPHPSGLNVLSIVIENDGLQTPAAAFEYEENYLQCDKKEMLRRIQAAGIAGLGGATFPTHVKLNPPPDKKIDTFILNGAECEPYLTADHRLMVESPEKILRGMEIIVKLLNVKNAMIGIEHNKPDAIKILRQKIAELGLPYKVHGLHVKYPQGAEKQLIKALTNRSVPAGGLPMDVGCVVQNVATAVAVYDAVAFQRPLTHRIVTVTGEGIKEPKNLLVPIGTPFSFVFEYCGGVPQNAAKIIMGGPMMGLAQGNLDAPVIKGTSGLLVLSDHSNHRYGETNCISCAHCIDVCPMGLMPKMLATWVKHERWQDAKEYHALDCIECGSCSFVCPAHINLVHHIKYGKYRVIQTQKKAG